MVPIYPIKKGEGLPKRLLERSQLTQKDVTGAVNEIIANVRANGDAALVEAIRNDRMPDSPLKGSANILVMPNMEAARISYNLLRVSSSEGVTVGPVLMGVAKPVHVLTPIASVRRIVNMVALAVVEAQTQPL